LAAVEKTKLLAVEKFPIPIQLVEKRISEICQMPLIAKNPFDNQSIFHFRVIRPNSTDNNPLHRDVWLEDYANCINLYIPIAGSDSNSSLVIIPKSHHWSESKIERTEQGAIIDGVKYNVPAVTAIHSNYEIVRPDPKENEVLIFSPYLIHGGSVNLNTDRTRISIELRLWKKS
jgi:ectoine hydroxylase-related dioxygenase (phytanoyl-CoA dioxygenase family)